MRLHVGGHIVKDETLQVSTLCGFCGAVGCRTTIVVDRTDPRKRKPGVQSSCVSAPRKDPRKEDVSLTLASVRKGSKSSPCTNMFLKRVYCTQETFIRKYGMADHVAKSHAEEFAMAKDTAQGKYFKAAYTVSSDEKDAVLREFKAGRRRQLADTNEVLPPNALRSVKGDGAPGRNVARTRSLEGEDENQHQEEDEDEQDGGDGGAGGLFGVHGRSDPGEEHSEDRSESEDGDSHDKDSDGDSDDEDDGDEDDGEDDDEDDSDEGDEAEMGGENEEEEEEEEEEEG